MRSFPSFERGVAEAVRQSGRIGYLFNNAGIGMSGEVNSCWLDDWNDVMRTPHLRDGTPLNPW